MCPPTPLPSISSLFSKEVLNHHMQLLNLSPAQHHKDTTSLAPIIASSALQHLESAAPSDASALQISLLAKSSPEPNTSTNQELALEPTDQDPRLFFNKSHTLSCMLEACLIPLPLGRLAKPLTAVVFHYDTFISDTKGAPCEAAFLASHPAVSVRVLCAPTNLGSILETYAQLDVSVEPLQVDQRHLNTKRMMDLMAVGQEDVPLYMETVKRILREMRITQQVRGGGFNYKYFKARVVNSGLTPAQMGPLNQRLETLESFMPSAQTVGLARTKKSPSDAGTEWKPVPGQLTIVDLSCPCISPETACSLFNICLGIFLQQDSDVGRVFALDEAHKYMNSSPEATVFTDTILSAVRLQRHLAVRAIISTQEPTVSTALLNLCSVTIVHRFSSPEWMRTLKEHLAAATDCVKDKIMPDQTEKDRTRPATLFEKIVHLNVGEALLFAPSAIVGVDDGENGRLVFSRLGGDHLSITVRGRLTAYGGDLFVWLSRGTKFKRLLSYHQFRGRDWNNRIAISK
ncbi:uncharacterized protein BO97DRAFT_459399 [Aspergillus homomorphus CBS 101889]|uniref:Uncharacterized protein n=1 Tax=Aspergillus homomorphus (strain CBS 101889) TaxID=1450537 RepID=A0A395HPM5_ASPHC|nr:hypothetical protein BO97DRAFT_459399 [Aspergillus homomorphus CBS 101889]RAL09215.1 hypothetical protein BO97DRAFT_459399 [Aspergillus homomorphus CBS 101889]